jgi:hypothetical protein
MLWPAFACGDRTTTRKYVCITNKEVENGYGYLPNTSVQLYHCPGLFGMVLE